MARTDFRLSKVAKRHVSTQNLLSNRYFNLQLSIETLNSPLSSIFLPLQAAKRRKSKFEIFKQKNLKISNFEQQERYIPQKKAKNMYNSDSARKSVIFCKKKYFFFNFSDFRDMLEDPLKFSTLIFLKISKKKSKNGLTGSYQTLKGTKS